MTEDTRETVTINGGKYILEDMSAEQRERRLAPISAVSADRRRSSGSPPLNPGPCGTPWPRPSLRSAPLLP